jgi:hypothetical protein
MMLCTVWAARTGRKNVLSPPGPLTRGPLMMTAAGISRMPDTAATLWFHSSVYVTKICQVLKDLLPLGPLRNTKKFKQTQTVTGSQKAEG